MLTPWAPVLLGGASGGCGFAALGVALYASSPVQGAAVALFAGIGFGAGLLCGGLHLVFDGVTPAPAQAITPEARANQATGGRPSMAELTAAALAGAATRPLPSALSASASATELHPSRP